MLPRTPQDRSTRCAATPTLRELLGEASANDLAA